MSERTQRVGVLVRLAPEDASVLAELASKSGRSYGELVSRMLLESQLRRELAGQETEGQ